MKNHDEIGVEKGKTLSTIFCRQGEKIYEIFIFL